MPEETLIAAMAEYHDITLGDLIEGIVLVVLAILAILIPMAASIAVTIILGWLFLVSGVVGLVTTFWARHAPGFWWALVSAVLATAAGIVLLLWPVSGSPTGLPSASQARLP